MTLDTRFTTAKARSQIINKHLWRDHEGARFPPDLSLPQKYDYHRKMHEDNPEKWDHGHDDYDDLSHYWGHYYVPKPLRIRGDRQTLKKWTITWHLANKGQHYDTIVGRMDEKRAHHIRLHGGDVGNWAGVILHYHPDPTNLSQVEYKEPRADDDEG